MIECDDVLAHVGAEVTITARLTLRTIFGCVRACPRTRVQFRVDGVEIGEAEAAQDGTAAVVYTPRQEREYQITASCRVERRGKTAAAHATLFSRGTRRPGIILDIDRTLFASSTFAAIFRRSRSISPLANAVDVTQELSRKYDLTIVTGRKRYLEEKTKRWLRMKGFPLAPVFFAPPFRPTLGHERFKFKLIRQLKASWPNITIGIGDRDSDARAYVANGLRAIIIREKGHCLPGAACAPDWRVIRELLLG